MTLMSRIMAKIMAKIIKTLGNLWVELDPREIHPENPGAGTPAMVFVKQGSALLSGTFGAVLADGEIDEVPLTRAQLKWLEGLEPLVEDMLEKHEALRA